MWLPPEMVAFTIGKRDGREPGHALHKNFCDAMVSGALRACDGVCRLVLPEIYFWWFGWSVPVAGLTSARRVARLCLPRMARGASPTICTR